MTTDKIDDPAEDLALLFMEEELGRHDWSGNWKKIKANGTALQRVQRWLTDLALAEDASKIVAFLDKMLASRSGKWL